MKIDKNHVLLVVSVITWVSFLVIPELTRDRIEPWDAAGFAANGALFLSAVQEFGLFSENPIEWLWAYYHDYPTVSVRRYPPLFGITEMFIYFFTGISVFGAKLTVFLYSLGLALGVYALGYRLWQDKLLAAAACFFIMSIPFVTAFSSTVRLDVPALAFAVWALFHYVEYIRSNTRAPLLLFVILLVLSIYTYQLTAVIGIAVAIHLLLLKKGSVFKDQSVWIAAMAALILLLPIIIQNLYMAQDQIATIGGSTPDKWKAFAPVANKLSMEYWIYYPVVLVKTFPVQTIGLAFWLVLTVRRGITQPEKLLLICGLVALVFFSWIPSKNSRYALYFIIPWSPLIIFAIRDVFDQLTEKYKQAASMVSAGTLLLLAGFQVVALPEQYVPYLTGMHEPAIDIVNAKPNARILYSGPRDSAFGFYIRQNDSARKTRLFRASVQAEHPEKIDEFIESNNINVVAIESGYRSSTREIYKSFSVYINRFLETHGEYKHYKTYYPRLAPQKGEPDNAREFQLSVFIRDSAVSSMKEME